MKSSSDGCRVLIADDDPAIAEALSAVLSMNGYSVCSSTSGGAALRAFDDHAADAVILDINLGDMSGLDVARALRARFGPAPYLIALTGQSLRPEEWQAAGFDLYATKPIEGRELTRLLDALHAVCVRRSYAQSPRGSSDRKGSASP